MLAFGGLMVTANSRDKFARNLRNWWEKDLTVRYSLAQSSVTLPSVLFRFLVLSVLFRLDSAKKWNSVLRRKLLPNALQQWLGIESLTDLVEQASVDWIPSRIFLETFSWHVTHCLAQCGVPQPVAVTRQIIRDLLLRDAEPCDGGISLNRSFWRSVVRKGQRSLSTTLQAECQERIEFVLGEVDLAHIASRRWLEMPRLTDAERAKLEAVQVADLSERLQALTLAFGESQFDFVMNLLACSYSRVGRRAHHPLLLFKVWLAMLSTGSMLPAGFLRAVDDSIQLRLFLGVMSHQQLPSARRIKSFAAERLSPVIEYLMLWHHFLLIGDEGIEIGTDFGTDSADMHAQGRMKSDAAAKHVTPLLGWLMEECGRFCKATGRNGLSESDRQVLSNAFEQLDWKVLGNTSLIVPCFTIRNAAPIQNEARRSTATACSSWRI